ncbi:MAG: Cytochrome c oxidase subunit 4 [Phylliscum demangeonii]|nr:MAG: Cytochrome c oxidase subunit 4 [Phylliscum demangeonii]
MADSALPSCEAQSSTNGPGNVHQPATTSASAPAFTTASATNNSIYAPGISMLQRSAATIARRAAFRGAPPLARRPFLTSTGRRSGHASSDPNLNSNPNGTPKDTNTVPGAERRMKTLSEIESEEDLLPPGAAPGTVPTDLEQATGLERYEILGKMEGIDVFDMRPLDSSRLGTLDDPLIVDSVGDEQYAGCTGHPPDSHNTWWLVLSRARPLGRCPECGNCIKMRFIGPPDDPDYHPYEDPKTFADYVRPEY